MIEINLQKIKFWLIVIIIQIASFGIGYYSANSFESEKPNQLLQTNYTTKQPEQPKAEAHQANNNSPTKDTEDCPVKGNISSKTKIYHVKGGSFYDRTDPEICFQTTQEAEAAGFVKSSR